MPWINQIEKAKTLEDLPASRTKTGTATGDFEMLDSKIVGGLMEIVHGDSCKKVFRQEENGQRNSRFMTRRQVAGMIVDHFKISGTDGTFRHQSDPLEVERWYENVQSFDTRWDETAIEMRKRFHDEALENLRFRQLDMVDQILKRGAVQNGNQNNFPT